MQIVKDNSGMDLGIAAFGDVAANNLLYNLKPNLWQSTDEGDFPGTYTGVMPGNLPLILAYELSGSTPSGWMQWMLNSFVPPPDGGISIQAPTSFDRLLYIDSTRPAISYNAQPLLYSSPGDNHFYGRSDWTTGAVWSSFLGNTIHWGDHQTRAAGHIAIQRGNDYLLVSNAQWKGSDGISGNPQIDDNESWRTNTLYFSDGGSLTTGTYGGGQGFWGTTGVVASKVGSNYVYAKANLVEAYPNGNHYPYNGSNTLTTFVRSYVFLGDKYWVVWDRAQSASSSYTMKRFWHFNKNGQPTLNQNTLTSTVGSSSLFVTTLLPASAMISVIGDGVSGMTDTNVSTYRAEVSNPSASTSLNALTVIDADSSSSSQPTTTIVSVTGGNMVGAQIADATPRVMLFSTDGTAQTSASYSTSYSGTGQHVIADLAPGNYTVILNGSQISSQTVGVDGTLSFSSASGALQVTQGVVVLTGITVSPSTTSIIVGSTQQFTATCIYSDNSQTNCTSTVTWTSSDMGASIQGDGLFAAGSSTGTFTVTAALGPQSATAQVTVVEPVVNDLAAIRVYPNPWRVDKHGGKLITFDMLPPNTTIKLFTVSGHLVRTLPKSTNSVTWDLKNDSGDGVASGIYLDVATTDDGQKSRGKVAIIR
jgi:hypothetical protein